jgi:hypothetical protein
VKVGTSTPTWALEVNCFPLFPNFLSF